MSITVGWKNIGDKKTKDSDDTEILTEDLLEHVYEDTYERLQDKNNFDLLNPLDEATFDTAFYTGEETKVWKYKGKKYTGNEINYIGIGMYEARRGHSLGEAKTTTRRWKRIMYNEKPSSGTYYWLEQGYEKYKKLKKEKAIEK